MRNVLKGNVMLIGVLLVGYCLAYPIKLTSYFYEKPLIDYFIFVLLFLSSFLLTRRFLWERKFLKYFALALIILPLGWFKLDFWSYSNLHSPQLITYLLILILGVSASALLKYPIVDKGSRWIDLFMLPFLVVGFVISFFSKEHDFIRFLVIYFTVGLTMGFWLKQRVLSILSMFFTIVFVIGTHYFPSPELFKVQSKYDDKVVFSVETNLQRIDITEWKGNHWFYTDGINQFSSIDSWLFYEPFVYPVLELAEKKSKILVIGGENGMLLNELQKAQINGIDVIPIDREYFKLSQNETLFRRYNQFKEESLNLNVLEKDVFDFLSSSNTRYDIVFMDVADPVDLERNQYFTKEFFQLVKARLNSGGLIVTQSGSPYFATEAFEIVQKTLESVGLNTLAFHNQVLTLGEWSWTIASSDKSKLLMKKRLQESDFSDYETEWLNNDAMRMMMSFGKTTRHISDLAINSMSNPVLYKYYLNGNYTLR